MKRQLFAVLVCMTMFAVTSCGEKKGKDKFEERIDCRLIYIKPADLIYISRPLFTIYYNGYFRS